MLRGDDFFFSLKYYVIPLKSTYSSRSCDSGGIECHSCTGKTLLCFESESQRSARAATTDVKEVEGVGLIFARFPTKEVALSLNVPCVQVDYAIGTYLLAYIGTTK